ncbi:MAG: Uma2 family endonuclease [Dysgonamonadaceae bacterium]|jgi:Uma2 family endonuclease|nr:Uma2 family endonuclease [Dysgonamonadaceae bacterium]
MMEEIKRDLEEKKTPMCAYSEEPSNVVEEPAAAYGGQRYSYADYLTWTDDVMREIINGIVYPFSAPLRRHAEAIIPFLTRAWLFIKRRKGKCEIYTAPFDVRLPKNGETDDNQIFNVVQPDICVVCDPSKLDEKGCIGAPDLIVEVSSPSTRKRDLYEKYNLYESVGVKEYWLVSLKNKMVTVFLLNPEGIYNEGIIYEVVRGQTKVPVQTLEGLVIDLEELFQE